MTKRTLKYGGKSGILPTVRPVFKRLPIRPKTEYEKEEAAKIEQGFAEGVPLPKRKGFKFERFPSEKQVYTVEERIKRNIEAKIPENIDESSLSNEELWKLKRDEIRRNHLREAYLVEAERLKKLDEIKLKEYEKKKAKEQTVNYEESETTKLTLPTLEAYLKGPIMRKRTKAEEIILKEQRTLNRKTLELQSLESKANKLLDLYHAAGNFITTEEELEQAITEAFEINFSKFDTAQSTIESRLTSLYTSSFTNIDNNERLIADKALGELNGKPGLQVIKDTLDGELERLKREARLQVNQGKVN